MSEEEEIIKLCVNAIKRYGFRAEIDLGDWSSFTRHYAAEKLAEIMDGKLQSQAKTICRLESQLAKANKTIEEQAQRIRELEKE